MNNKLIKFDSLSLIKPILLALQKTGYQSPTPIQEKAIPVVLAGHDLLGIAQTGTGKTAAFCLPIIQKLYQSSFKPKSFTPRVLILAPTRELAIQIDQDFKNYSQFSMLKSTTIFGGVSQVPQVEQMRQGVDIVVATTGRLLDLVQQKFMDLSKIEILVLDEADRMLDMGFLPDIHKILDIIPKKKQSLLFSATMPKEISDLSKRLLNNPKKIEVSPQSSTAEKIKQSAYFVEKTDKLSLLIHLLQDENLKKVILFVDMKHLANRIVEKLLSYKISAAALHSDKSQGARQRALEEFRNGQIRVLVATDIAARGIDVDGITHVLNYDLSHILENYIHRIGRTARAGASGLAISFCGEEEKSFLYGIEKLTGQKIEIIYDSPFHSEKVELAEVVSVGKAKAILEAKKSEGKKGQRPQFKKRGKPQGTKSNPNSKSKGGKFFNKEKGKRA